MPDPTKKINGFTGEEEDAPPLNMSASPADQRILSAPPHTDPLPELIDRAINSPDDAGVDIASHQGPSLTEDSLPGETPLPVVPQHDTPELNPESTLILPTQHTDVPSTNKALIEEGAQVATDGREYPGLDTAEYNESIDARKEAEAEGVAPDQLPEIKPPIPGDQVTDTPTEPQEEGQEDENGVPVEPSEETQTSEGPAE